MAGIKLKWTNHAKDKGLTGKYHIRRSTNINITDYELSKLEPIYSTENLDTNTYTDTTTNSNVQYKYLITTETENSIHHGRSIIAIDRPNMNFGTKVLYGNYSNGICLPLTTDETTIVINKLKEKHSNIGFNDNNRNLFSFYFNDKHYIYVPITTISRTELTNIRNNLINNNSNYTINNKNYNIYIHLKTNINPLLGLLTNLNTNTLILDVFGDVSEYNILTNVSGFYRIINHNGLYTVNKATAAVYSIIGGSEEESNYNYTHEFGELRTIDYGNIPNSAGIYIVAEY